MSVQEFAVLSARFGAKIIERDGVYWRRVRPFFYRPLHSSEALDGSGLVPPVRWPAGYQYATAGGRPANSTLNFIILDRLQEYSLDAIGHRRRHLIKQAAGRFAVRRIENLEELQTQGYKAYLSFFQRTRYGYRSDRVQRSRFAEWAGILFRHPKVILLGAYGEEGLTAVSCSYWVNDSLLYTTFYAETESLRRNVGEVMFHELRLAAARIPAIREVMIRPYKGGESMDQYYLLRGGKIVRKPARLEVNRFALAAIRRIMPGEHALLTGET
jgi:hypothetical protein